jgi:hypothetical protein
VLRACYASKSARIGRAQPKPRRNCLPITEAATRFHRLKGYREIAVLVRSLRQQDVPSDAKQAVA